MAEEEKNKWAKELLRNTKRAARRGDWYTLCTDCRRRENNNLPATPGCTVGCAMVNDHSLGWTKDGMVLVACFVAQICRNNQADGPGMAEKIAAGTAISIARKGGKSSDN